MTLNKLLLSTYYEQCHTGRPSHIALLLRIEPSRLQELNLQLIRLLAIYISLSYSPLDLLSVGVHNGARMQDDRLVSKVLWKCREVRKT